MRWFVVGALVAVLVAGSLIGEYLYDQQMRQAALTNQRAQDRQALAVQRLADRGHEVSALATARAIALATARVDALATARVDALATARIAIPTAVQGTAVARETATSVAGATSVARTGATARAVQTATALATPAFVHVCKAVNYTPTLNVCAIDDRGFTVSEANDAHLVLDARNSQGHDRTIRIDVEQTQVDGTLKSVNTVNATLNGNYGSTSWKLPSVLPTNFFSGVNPGQYQINVTVDGQDLPIYYATVYQ